MDALIEKVIAHRPDDVAQLFATYGYNAEPTVKNLQNLVKVYGDKPYPVNNAVGDIVQPKKTLLDKIVGIATGIGNIITANKQKAVAIPGTVYAGTNTNGNDPEQTPRILGINRTVFLVFAALVVVAFGIVLFKKRG